MAKLTSTYIDKDAAGNFFEPKVGQTVRDIQSGATAVVTYYQRNSNNATVFVKTVTGTWSQGELIWSKCSNRILSNCR